MESNEVREALGQCDLFKDFDESRYTLLTESAELTSYPQGKAIYAKGGEADRTFGLIVSGEAEALSEGGMTLRKLGPGQIIGEIRRHEPSAEEDHYAEGRATHGSAGMAHRRCCRANSGTARAAEGSGLAAGQRLV